MKYTKKKSKKVEGSPAEELGESKAMEAQEDAEGQPEGADDKPKSRDGALTIVIQHAMSKRKSKKR